MRNFRRAGLGAAHVALAAACLSAPLSGTAAADVAAVDITRTACPPGLINTGQFTDVGPDHPFELEIGCLADHDIAHGDGGLFRPGQIISRAQMALFVHRIWSVNGWPQLTHDGRLPPTAFQDIQQLSWGHQRAITELEYVGIVHGTTTTTFSPGAPVTRAQMAMFLSRLHSKAFGHQQLPVTGDHFVDDGHLNADFQAAINGIASIGVARGTSNGRFSPEAGVTRQQMAGFLVRYLELLQRDGYWYSAVENITVTSLDDTTQPLVSGPDESPDDDREYSVTGLVPGQEYVISVVNRNAVEFRDGTPSFYRGMGSPDARVYRGWPNTDIVLVDGAPPQWNPWDGAELTTNDRMHSDMAVFVAPADSRPVTFVLDGDVKEIAFPIVHRNGGGAASALFGRKGGYDGGAFGELEENTWTGQDEPFGYGGSVTFTAG